MSRTNRRSKALNDSGEKHPGMFRALIFGVLTCFVCWIVLALVFAFIMNTRQDSNAYGNILSPIIPVLSLLAGGFAAGKADKSCAYLSAVVLGCMCLAISYILSSVLDLSKGMNTLYKTVVVISAIVCPLVGAKLSLSKKKQTRHKRKRM